MAKKLVIDRLFKEVMKFKREKGWSWVELTRRMNAGALNSKVRFYREMWYRLEDGILPTIDHLRVMEKVMNIGIFK